MFLRPYENTAKIFCKILWKGKLDIKQINDGNEWLKCKKIINL